ncbi:MAG: chorismate-binding protein [Labilibaculum sp.]|nr:chorismate-binding protein [Labilibaculum sp.]MBI9058862.1 chorismate-binding protein [Labilibaculum sp.]
MIKNRNEVTTFLNYCLQNNNPFFAYQLPKEKEIHVGVQKDADLCDYQNLNELVENKGFVFSPFDTDGIHKAWCIRSDIDLEASEIKTESIQLLGNEELSFVNSSDLGEVFGSSQALYYQQVKSMIHDLQQKALDKVILSRIEILDGIGRSKATSSFLKLTEAYDSAFVFYVSIPGIGTWIGASPETLLSVNKDKIETVALAGTQKIGNRLLDQIHWEEKEVNEQAFVSQYIENIFEEHQLNEIEREGPTTVQAGNVVHLKTSYRLPLKMNFDQLSNFVKDLHPTPAVCGLPKKKAISLINKLEKHDREYYAGYLGPINSIKKISLFVNLRSMKVLENKMALYVGGGITADSIPEKEWEETCLKAQTLLNVITK